LPSTLVISNAQSAVFQETLLSFRELVRKHAQMCFRIQVALPGHLSITSKSNIFDIPFNSTLTHGSIPVELDGLEIPSILDWCLKNILHLQEDARSTKITMIQDTTYPNIHRNNANFLQHIKSVN
jgi:hypothetical protein